MTPPPGSGRQINPFGMPPLVDADRLDTEQSGGDVRLAVAKRRLLNGTKSAAALIGR
jgi:hypothetical protein